MIEKKFLIVAPIIDDKPWYWCKVGCGNTDNALAAWRFSETQARELVEKEPLLKMVPAP